MSCGVRDSKGCCVYDIYIHIVVFESKTLKWHLFVVHALSMEVECCYRKLNK